tara:strand:+ start:2611 stop:4956 length:2346 start_codon:yes stop_codon:yes gene_type:complete
MGYQNIKDALSQYGNTLNKTEEDYMGRNSISMEYDQKINPYSSRGYVDNTYRGLASEKADMYSPMDMYKDGAMDPTLLTRATQGATYFKGAQTASPYISDIAQQFTGNPGAALTESFNLGPAAFVYGATRNNNPYDYTKTESYGTTASTMMAAHQISKFAAASNAGTALKIGTGGINPWVMAGSYLLSRWFNKKGRDKAKKLVGEEHQKIEDFQTEQSEFVEERFGKQREESLARQDAAHYDQMANQYNNQYGAYSDPYRNSYSEGGKVTKEDLQDVEKLGRYGDTDLVHVNKQEKQMLKDMGGAGTINPYTGLEEYHLSLSHVGDAINTIVGGAFNAVGSVIDPILGGAADVVTTVGDGVSDVVDTVASGVTEGVKSLGHDVLIPATQAVGEPILDALGNVIDWLTPESYEPPDMEINDRENPDMNNRDPKAVKGEKVKGEKGKANIRLDNAANVDDSKANTELNKFKWELDNPYITEDVEQFNEGGVAEGTDPVESLPMDSLFNRQIYKESSFDPEAESGAGAVGLTQIMPNTFKYFQDKGWVPEGKKFSDLKTDTDLAQTLQEKYMNDLMSRSWNKGSEQVKRAKALAAYNMGPTKLVEKLNALKKEGKDVYEGLDWVNELNTETSDYVTKVLLGGDAKFEAGYKKQYDKKGNVYNEGGINDNIVAEFTGNELIVNDQDLVEQGLAEGNFTKAAAPIKRALNRKQVTPGEETHQGNPIPVDSEGNIYAAGGKLKFKVGKGAGVYDHADEQFTKGMTDKEIAMVAQKNINKWKSNNMHS